jgi:hypothetical protein
VNRGVTGLHKQQFATQPVFPFSVLLENRFVSGAGLFDSRGAVVLRLTDRTWLSNQGVFGPKRSLSFDPNEWLCNLRRHQARAAAAAASGVGACNLSRVRRDRRGAGRATKHRTQHCQAPSPACIEHRILAK